MAMPVLLLAGLIAIAGMAWQVGTDQQILFLRHQAGARWIHVARPFEFGSWRDASLSHTSEFRVAFELSSERRPSEPAPELILHALRAVAV
jgi:hypothetical protein